MVPMSWDALMVLVGYGRGRMLERMRWRKGGWWEGESVYSLPGPNLLGTWRRSVSPLQALLALILILSLNKERPLSISTD